MSRTTKPTKKPARRAMRDTILAAVREHVSPETLAALERAKCDSLTHWVHVLADALPADAGSTWTKDEVLTVAHQAGLPLGKILELAGLPVPEGAADYQWLLSRVFDAIRESGIEDGKRTAAREIFYKSGEHKWDAAHERTVGDLAAGALGGCLFTKNVSAGLLELVQLLLSVVGTAEEVDGGLDPKFSMQVRHRIQVLAEHGGVLAARVDAARSRQEVQ